MFQQLTLIKKILLGLVLLLIPIKVNAKITPTNEFYVNDYANILSKSTEERIINLNKKLYAKTGAQIDIVIINDLGGDSIENVANTTFNDFQIGSKDNNGLLILFAKNDRKVRVEVGYGLEGTLNDGKVGRMMDQYMIPLFKEDKFAEGLENGFNAFFNYLLDYYDIDDIENQNVIDRSDKETQKIILDYMSGVIKDTQDNIYQMCSELNRIMDARNREARL